MTELLEKLRKLSGMNKNRFYNIIFGTNMEEFADNIFHVPITSSEISRFSANKSVAGNIRDRFKILSQTDRFGDLAAHYKKNLPLPDNDLINIFNSFKQKNSVGADIGIDTNDFYLYLAHLVKFSILNFKENIKSSDNSFTPNDEPIFDQIMRIFSDDNINYIVIATQVGMILLTNDRVRTAVINYLRQGKTLEVIINTPDIRDMIGRHMRNPDISHQTDTRRICELWKELKEEVGNAALMVAATDTPILHQIIKTSTKINDTEQNININIRLYAYKVRNKNDNISFTLTSSSDKYKIIKEELEFLSRDAIEDKDFIINPEPDQS